MGVAEVRTGSALRSTVREATECGGAAGSLRLVDQTDSKFRIPALTGRATFQPWPAA